MVAILEVINYLKVTIRIVIILVLLNTDAKAQNLIKNGGFEQSDECPTKPGQLELCSNWSIPNHSTPDLLKKCHHIKSFVNIPMNAMGFQDAYSGEAYVGLAIIYGKDRYYRKYIQGELTEALTVGKYYNVSFYISWADHSNNFCDWMGYLFTESKVEPEPKVPDSKKKERKKERVEHLPRNTILPRSDGYIPLSFDAIQDRESWHKVEFIYQAKGGERYLTMGLFGDNATEEDYDGYMSQVYGDPSKSRAGTYLYMDDISVIPVDEIIDYTHGN